VKKQNAQLNLAHGCLKLSAGGTVEFKSSSAGLAIETDYDKIATMSPENTAERISMSGDKKSNATNVFSQKRQSETVSRQSHAERSLQFMQ